jgi:uncharacterized membrane protein YhhN
MIQPLRLVFVILCLGDLLGIYTNNEFLRHCCKPLITVSLLVYYWVAARNNRSYWVVVALICCFFGDSFLLYDHLNNLYFLLGLGAFLLGHIAYAIAFMKHQDRSASQLQNIQKLRIAVPIMLYGVLLLIILQPSLGNLKIPVYIYAVMLITMALSALMRLGRTNTPSFAVAFLGACLFLVSDSVLAINKFHHTISGAGFIIMVSYMAAQYFIIDGFLKHYKTN